MRELGRQGGKARRAGVAAKLPEAERRSLRDVLRSELDPLRVKAAIEQSLAGGNESARVQAVRFLADLELYRQDGECPRCAARAADAEAGGHRARLIELLSRRADGWAEQADEHNLVALAGRVEQLEAELVEERARLQALREEHGVAVA